MPYTFTKAISDLLDYLGLEKENIRVINATRDRGFVCNINNEDIVIFTYPISCKAHNAQNFFDTRDSGAEERKTAWGYARIHHLKYFCLAVNTEQERYRDYILSLESSEEDIRKISYRRNENDPNATGTQINIPNDFIPSGWFKRIRTPKGFYISAVHRSHIKEYLQHFDNRPYYEDNEMEETEVLPEKEREELAIEHSKECARKITDLIYDHDQFGRIKAIFENNDKYIKINTDDLGGNYLRFMFAKPISEAYNENPNGKTRVYTDKDYIIAFSTSQETCRLSTEWVSVPPGAVGQSANHLLALIKIVNQYYSDFISIYEEDEKWYLEYLKHDFSANDLPDVFRTEEPSRFITSLLAKPFVILTGNSGTGKTRIAKQFAQYLEVKDENEEKNWLIVPVGADWTDNSKVIGFFNPLAEEGKGKYVKTDILELIERANAHPDIPYFLILDEMNLSHVERYFSDFLSHMETPDVPFEIDGYGILDYPENLFVVGTVNIDETTYMFSPKVLDRANVIEFKPSKEDVLNKFDGSAHLDSVPRASVGTAQGFLRLAREIRADDNSADNQVAEIFGQIYDIAEKKGFEFAYRTVKEIRLYIDAAHKLSDKWEEEEIYRAIDEQLLQKVLPKIHGNRKEIGEMLDELSAVCDQEGKKLERSLKKIEQMKGKLASVQYASFI